MSPTSAFADSRRGGPGRDRLPNERVRWMVSALVGLAWLAWTLATRWDQLDSPPYVEHAGWWIEASFLADTNFDYGELIRSPHGATGGPRCYLSSLLPSLLAILMQRFGPEVTLPIVHGLVFASVSLLVGLCVWLAAGRLPMLGAVLVGLVFGTIPIVSVQTELPSMDLLMGAALIPSIVLLERGRLLSASLWSVVPFVLKNSAFLFPAAMAGYAYLGLLWMLLEKGRISGRLLALAVVSTCMVVVEYSITVLAGNTESRLRFFLDIALWLQSTPELLLVLFISAVGSLRYVLRRTRADGWVCFWGEEPLFLVGWILVVVNHLAILAMAYEARYVLIVLPFLLTIASQWMGRDGTRVWWPTLFFAAWLGFNLVNADGRLLPPLVEQARRGFGIPERSLEYRADHASNREFCRRLDELHGEVDLLVADQLVFFVESPRLGYVSQPLAGWPVPYFFVAEHANIAQLLDRAPAEIAVAYVPSQLGELGFPAYHLPPPGPKDRVLLADGLVPENILYRRSFSSEGSWSRRCKELVDLLFSNATELDPAARLAVVGFEKQARRMLGEDLGLDPASPLVTSGLVSRLEQTAARGARLLKSASSRGAFDRLLPTLDRRIRELRQGVPLEPLSWEDRGLDAFIPQRIRYLSRFGVQRAENAATGPENGADPQGNR